MPYVQYAANIGQTATSPTVIITGVAAGATLLLIISEGSNNRNVNSVTDGTNTWAVAVARITSSGSSRGFTVYAAYNVPAGNYTITAAMDGASALYTLTVVEFSGLTTASTPVDKVASANAEGAQTVAIGPTATTSQDSEDVVAIGFSNIAARPYSDPGGGYTRRVDLTTASTYLAVWTKSQTTAAAQSVTLSSAPNNQFHLAAIVTLKLSLLPRLLLLRRQMV